MLTRSSLLALVALAFLAPGVAQACSCRVVLPYTEPSFTALLPAPDSQDVPLNAVLFLDPSYGDVQLVAGDETVIPAPSSRRMITWGAGFLWAEEFVPESLLEPWTAYEIESSGQVISNFSTGEDLAEAVVTPEVSLTRAFAGSSSPPAPPCFCSGGADPETAYAVTSDAALVVLSDSALEFETPFETELLDVSLGSGPMEVPAVLATARFAAIDQAGNVSPWTEDLAPEYRSTRSGCSCSDNSSSGSFALLAAFPLLGGLRRRRS